MRKMLALAFAALGAASASAELQSVEVGGELKVRLRGNINYQNEFGAPSRTLIPAYQVLGRPIGASGLGSRFRFDDEGADRFYGEMYTRLNVTSRFTDNVATFIEFESTNILGEEFRGNYLTGLDTAGAGDDVNLIQAYIEADEFFGYPLRLRLGRQTMRLGNGWLVGDMHSSMSATFFDGARATWSQDNFEVDAWWFKLGEALAEDEDIDFYGLYGTYKGFESVQLSAYWMLVRDGRSLEETDLGFGGEWLEDVFGRDDYGTTMLHTVGTHISGGWNAFDFDWELAYQFGEADQVGIGFAPLVGGYGDDGAEFGNFGTDLELGYTFDTRFSPRPYIGAAWLEGEDNRDISFWEFLQPFNEAEASVSFNRLFAYTSEKYSYILDAGQVLSNFQAIRLGVELKPTEKTELYFELEQFWADEPFRRPRTILPFTSFWTEESDDNLGLLFQTGGRYWITEDLWIRFRWDHFFTGDGLADGNFSDRNGLMFFQGSDDDDADYIETMVGIKF